MSYFGNKETILVITLSQPVVAVNESMNVPTRLESHEVELTVA